MKIWVAVAIPVAFPLSQQKYIAAGNSAAAAKASLMSQLGDDPCERRAGLFFIPDPQEVEIVEEYRK